MCGVCACVWCVCACVCMGCVCVWDVRVWVMCVKCVLKLIGTYGQANGVLTYLRVSLQGYHIFGWLAVVAMEI